MKKKPVFVAVSNQKGGVGKSTMLVALASLLNYTMDKSVAIVDCDATQRSLYNLRERDKEMVEKNKRYMTLLEEPPRFYGCPRSFTDHFQCGLCIDSHCCRQLCNG